MQNSRNTVPISQEEYNLLDAFTQVIMKYDLGKEDEETKKIVYGVLYKTYRKIENSCIPKEERVSIRKDYNRLMTTMIKYNHIVDDDSVVTEAILEVIKQYHNAIKSLILYVLELPQI
jgi:hypothetical protein